MFRRQVRACGFRFFVRGGQTLVPGLGGKSILCPRFRAAEGAVGPIGRAGAATPRSGVWGPGPL
eukprot:9139967-Alexandrium_andersonii.AAC.1